MGIKDNITWIPSGFNSRIDISGPCSCALERAGYNYELSKQLEEELRKSQEYLLCIQKQQKQERRKEVHMSEIADAFQRGYTVKEGKILIEDEYFHIRKAFVSPGKVERDKSVGELIKKIGHDRV